MLLAYFISAFLLASGLFLMQGMRWQRLWVGVFAICQIGISLYALFFWTNESSSYFMADALGRIFLSLLSLISVTTLVQSFVYLAKRNEAPRQRSIYFSSMILFIASMTGVFLSNHIGVMWVFTEATTLSIALLIYHERTAEAIEATWKYVFISTLGLSFSFIGILLLDIGIGDFNAASFTFTEQQEYLTSVQNREMLQIAFVLIVIGFSVKMGVFPLHTVCIDAHSVAPGPVSAMVSTSLMNVGFVAVFRFYTLLSKSSLHSWTNHVLLIVGGLTVLFSAIYLVRVKNIKRLVAYSSIENMGIVAIAIGAGGIAWFAAVYHLVIHTLVKSGIFYQLTQIIRYYNTKKVNSISGFFRVSPVGGIVMILAFFMLAGIPPSGLFFSEWMIFTSLIGGGYAWMAVAIMLLLCFIIFTLGRYFFSALFGPDPVEVISPTKPSAAESLPQLFLMFVALWLSLSPPYFLLSAIREAVSILPR